MSHLDPNAVRKLYEGFPARYKEAREKYGRPLTLTEKILTAHLDRWPEDSAIPVRGETYAFLRPDRVAMQDATAQMALLQFMQAQLKKVAVPTTVHCDHLIQARVGRKFKRFQMCLIQVSVSHLEVLVTHVHQG